MRLSHKYKVYDDEWMMNTDGWTDGRMGCVSVQLLCVPAKWAVTGIDGRDVMWQTNEEQNGSRGQTERAYGLSPCTPWVSKVGVGKRKPNKDTPSYKPEDEIMTSSDERRKANMSLCL